MKEKDSELHRDANSLGLPNGFDWPQEVQAEIDLWDTAYSEWDDAHLSLSEKHRALKQANEKDSQALVNAVRDGKPDPGTKATDKAEREVVYWEEVARQARARSDKQAVTVWRTIQAHYVDIVNTANARAIAGADEFAADMDQLSKQGREAVEKRNRAYEGLRFVSRLTGGELSFDPFFPIEGTLSVPYTGENRVRSIVTLLEKTVTRREPVEAS